MRKLSIVSLFVCAAMLAGTALEAAGNANFILGQRSMRDDIFEFIDQDQQPLFGVNVDFGGAEWPVQMQVGLHVSAESTTFAFDETLDTATADVSFGVVWYPIKDRTTRPYVGGGFSSIGVAADDGFDSESDQSFAAYINGGVFWRLGQRFNIGLDLRINRGGEVTLGDETFATDYEQLGLLLGFGWGN